MERDFKGVWIPKEIWLNKELSLIEKVLLVEINSLDNDFGCTAGNEYFANFFNVTERTISKSITRLKDLGFVSSSFDGRIRTLRVENFSMQSRKNYEAHINNNTENNIKHSIENTNKQQVLFNTNKEVLEVRKSEQGQWFVDTYNSICVSLPKCQRLNAKRSKAISRVLKNYSEEEILTAFNNLENSDFCKGKNDSGWKADIDFLLKEDKFDRVLEGRYNDKKRGCKAEVITPGEKYRVSAEEKEEMRKAVERGELKEY